MTLQTVPDSGDENIEKDNVLFVPGVSPGGQAPTLDQIKCKEKWLRDEIRHCRENLFKLLHSGTWMMSGSMYYFRQDTFAQIRSHSAILPDPAWLIGTLWLTLIATVFCAMCCRILVTYRRYRNQLALMDRYSQIDELPPKHMTLHFVLFYSFPLFDILFWSYCLTR